MQGFIARMKDRMREEGVDVSYLCITNNNRNGVRIGDALVFFEPSKNNQYALRIFAPRDVKVERVDATGEPLK